MWPNTAMRHLRMREMMLSSLVRSNTVVLVTNWSRTNIIVYQGFVVGETCEMPEVAARLFVGAPTLVTQHQSKLPVP